ncbi:MAG: hypothetical protein FWF00_03955 [Endomicrobia bacterium]|nr:hypothetical protein [Endomicrobiia bacterium]MCL2506825.1 hypothetical protein [Endomicrobiia bacterium]
MKKYTIKEIFEKLSEPDRKIILKKLSVKAKLLLWLKDIITDFDFDEYKKEVNKLSKEDQQLFIKKLFKEKPDIKLDDLKSVNVTDLTTKVIIHSIADIMDGKADKDGINLAYKNVLANIRSCIDVTDNVENLRLDGYFDKGSFRTRAKRNMEKKWVLYSDDYPCEKFCDGRKNNSKKKAKDKDKYPPFEFWWCWGMPCYKTARKKHDALGWKNYTIFDFCDILKINFSDEDYGLYLGAVNKANKYLPHLKCRKCNMAFSIKGQSNHAVQRINSFYCQNPECEEKDKEIYITHCLNKRCKSSVVIDSRDTVQQCANDRYICNYCHSCCDTRSMRDLAGRRGEDVASWALPGPGHRDRGIICCNKCDGEMKKLKININVEEYNKILSWLNENNIRAGDGWWLIYQDDEQERVLRKAGFAVKGGYNPSQSFVSVQPKTGQVNIVCEKCGYVLDMEDDHRRFAIVNFHKVFFGEKLTKDDIQESSDSDFDPDDYDITENDSNEHDPRDYGLNDANDSCDSDDDDISF